VGAFSVAAFLGKGEADRQAVMATERNEIYVHMQPSFVFVGDRDHEGFNEPDKLMVGVQLNAKAKELLTDKDRLDIGNGIANVIRGRIEENQKGMIVLPGTGLLIPANNIRGGKK
jgi:hypothetical protein